MRVCVRALTLLFFGLELGLWPAVVLESRAYACTPRPSVLTTALVQSNYGFGTETFAYVN